MKTLTLSAPAKINLTLRVLGKRDDGFHELETLMYPLRDLADRLTLTESDHYELSCDDPTVPVDESNLVSRALRAFEVKTGRTCRYRVHLEKSVPHGAGLGGGSSDAATVLLALNELEGTGLSLDELSEIAAKFGSDTSFFIYGKAGWCRGRGELVTPVDVAVKGAVVLLKPEFSIPTPETFRAWADSRELPHLSYAAQSFDWGELVNDLERPVYQKYLFLAETKAWLQSQSEVSGALMSGSGSTMFALVPDLESGQALVERAKRELDPKFWSSLCRLG